MLVSSFCQPSVKWLQDLCPCLNSGLLFLSVSTVFLCLASFLCSLMSWFSKLFPLTDQVKAQTAVRSVVWLLTYMSNCCLPNVPKPEWFEPTLWTWLSWWCKYLKAFFMSSNRCVKAQFMHWQFYRPDKQQSDQSSECVSVSMSSVWARSPVSGSNSCLLT